MQDVREIRDALSALQVGELIGKYNEVFAPDVAPETADQGTLVQKLTYAEVMRQAKAENVAVDKRTAAAAKKWFDAPWKAPKEKKAPKEPRYTIQMFIVDRLWELVESGQNGTVSTSDLAQEVIAKFPTSVYPKNPIGRMKIDIRKFNQGMFEYGKKVGKVPANADQHYKPKPEPVAEKAA